MKNKFSVFSCSSALLTAMVMLPTFVSAQTLELQSQQVQSQEVKPLGLHIEKQIGSSADLKIGQVASSTYIPPSNYSQSCGTQEDKMVFQDGIIAGNCNGNSTYFHTDIDNLPVQSNGLKYMCASRFLGGFGRGYNFPAGYIIGQTVTVGTNICRSTTMRGIIINQRPIVPQPLSFSIPKNTFASSAVTISEPDGEAMTFTLSSVSAPAPGATVSLNRQGNTDTYQLVYNAATGYSGTDEFSIKVDDGRYGVSYIYVTVEVSDSENQLPVSALPNNTISTNQNTVIDLIGIADDPDGENALISYGYTLDTAHGEIYFGRNDAQLGEVWVYRPDNNFYGTDSAVVSAQDQYGGTSIFALDIEVAPTDADNDGLPDTWEALNGLSAQNAADALWDGDSDNLNNLGEYANGTDPEERDTDGDGMLDGFEVFYAFLSPTDDSDASGDQDLDGYTNLQEHDAGTDPDNANSTPAPPNQPPVIVQSAPVTVYDAASTNSIAINATDSDNDSLTFTVNSTTLNGGSVVMDGLAINTFRYTRAADFYGSDEVTVFVNDGNGHTVQGTVALNVVLQDFDQDGMGDLWEMTYQLDHNNANDANLDLDGDGLINLHEYQNGTRPNHVDTDGDGMNDAYEVARTFLDPTDATDAADDQDQDGYSNIVEHNAGSDPDDANSIPPANMPPVIIPYATPVVVLDTSNSNSIAINAEDPEGDAMTFSVEATTSGGGTVMMDGVQDYTFAYTRAADFYGNDEVTVYVEDTNGNITTGIIVLTVVAQDLDLDGMGDLWETDNQLDPNSNDAALDPDLDGLTNLLEYQNDTNPRLADTDGDGMDDSFEVRWAFLNPNLASDANDDQDQDDYTNLEEYNANSDPSNAYSIPIDEDTKWLVVWIVTDLLLLGSSL